MKKLLIIFLFAGAAQAQFNLGNYKFYYEDEYGRYYYDSSSMQVDGDQIKFFEYFVSDELRENYWEAAVNSYSVKCDSRTVSIDQSYILRMHEFSKGKVVGINEEGIVTMYLGKNIDDKDTESRVYRDFVIFKFCDCRDY